MNEQNKENTQSRPPCPVWHTDGLSSKKFQRCRNELIGCHTGSSDSDGVDFVVAAVVLPSRARQVSRLRSQTSWTAPVASSATMSRTRRGWCMDRHLRELDFCDCSWRHKPTETGGCRRPRSAQGQNVEGRRKKTFIGNVVGLQLATPSQ